MPIELIVHGVFDKAGHEQGKTINLLLENGVLSKRRLTGVGAYFQDFVYSSVPDNISKICERLSNDIVLIEVDDQTPCYDHGDKNDRDPTSNRKSLPIREYKKQVASGVRPFKEIPEVLHQGQIPPEKIVAYAKLEKHFRTDSEIQKSDEELIKKYINSQLKKYTYLDSGSNVAFFYEHDFLGKGKKGHHIRVLYDKQKATGHEQEISDFFSQFNSLDSMLKAAKSNELQSSPVQSSPVQSSPVQSSPVQSSPVQSSPVQSNNNTENTIPQSTSNSSIKKPKGPGLVGSTHFPFFKFKSNTNASSSTQDDTQSSNPTIGRNKKPT